MDNLLPNLHFVYLVHEPRPDDDIEEPRRFMAVVKGDAQAYLGMSELKGAFISSRKAWAYAQVQARRPKNFDKRRIRVAGKDNAILKVYKG